MIWRMENLVAQRITLQQISDWLSPTDGLLVLISGTWIFGVALLHHSWAEAGLFALLGVVASTIMLIDLRHFRIPDLLSLPLILLGLAATILAGAPLTPRFLVMVSIWSLLMLTQWVFLALRGRSCLGSGDIKLMAAAAIWLEPSSVPPFVLAASATGLFEGLLKRKGLQGRIAFGAHLAPWLVVFVLTA